MKISVLVSLFWLCVSLTLAQETSPTPASPASTPPTAVPVRSPAPNAQPLYELEYDEEKDLFYEIGTTTPFTGPVTWRNEENKALELTGELRNGQRHGWWQELHANGRVASEGSYADGRETGWWRFWYENGQLETEGEFLNGEMTGEWKSYFENGKMESVGRFERSKMVGPWKFHDPETGKEKTLTPEEGDAAPAKTQP